MRHSAAKWLHSHQLSEAEADHHQIWLADKTLRCHSSSVPRHLSDDAMCHLWRLQVQQPCPVWKRFNIDHADPSRLKPGSQIVGSQWDSCWPQKHTATHLSTGMKCQLETGQTKSAFWKLGEVEGGWRSPGTLAIQGDFQQFAAAVTCTLFIHLFRTLASSQDKLKLKVTPNYM